MGTPTSGHAPHDRSLGALRHAAGAVLAGWVLKLGIDVVAFHGPPRLQVCGGALEGICLWATAGLSLLGLGLYGTLGFVWIVWRVLRPLPPAAPVRHWLPWAGWMALGVALSAPVIPLLLWVLTRRA
jgi:hypothetical protein